jgi:AAA+ superfamily predicted ATPase
MAEKIYLDADLQGEVSSISVESHLGASLERIEARYFLDKYGTLPYEGSVYFPRGLGSLLDQGLCAYMAAGGFVPLNLYYIPTREEEVWTQGKWISGDKTLILRVEDDPPVLVYHMMAQSLDAANAAMKELREHIDKIFRKKVVAWRDTPRFLSATEISKAKSWTDLKPSIDPEVAGRIDEVLLPFFARAKQFKGRGVPTKLGVLFYGSPGTGKTYLLRTLIREFAGKATVAHLAADQFVGFSTSAMRKALEFLHRFAPLVLILEDIEVLASDRHQREGSSVTMLLDVMDGAINEMENTIFLATTNLYDKIDSAFKRPGRFDEVLEFGPPQPQWAAPAFASYFKDARLTIPDKTIVYVSDLGMTYAELRYVAHELIRIAMLSGAEEIKATPTQLGELARRASRGIKHKQAMGFRAALDKAQGDGPTPSLGHFGPHIG